MRTPNRDLASPRRGHMDALQREHERSDGSNEAWDAGHCALRRPRTTGCSWSRVLSKSALCAHVADLEHGDAESSVAGTRELHEPRDRCHRVVVRVVAWNAN